MIRLRALRWVPYAEPGGKVCTVRFGAYDIDVYDRALYYRYGIVVWMRLGGVKLRRILTKGSR